MATKSWVMIMGLAGVMVIGCASVPLPGAELNHFQASMATAAQIGVFKVRADSYHRGALGMPPAEEHLLLALDQFDLAKTMASEGNPRSRFLLARAQSDVDIALCLTREAAVRSQMLGLNPFLLQFPWRSTPCEETTLRTNILNAAVPKVVSPVVAGPTSLPAASTPGMLMEARASFVASSTSPAAGMARSHLDDARAALEKANQAFAARGDSPACQDYAYIAENKVQLADIVARIELEQEMLGDMNRPVPPQHFQPNEPVALAR
ncbi:MAG TPA: DUF4398 domain-containing protein [Polyangia bacterium]|jgi:hypothetical protein|nr:DUF4398 domain-containing protein [Polyangia bacterium]